MTYLLRPQCHLFESALDVEKLLQRVILQKIIGSANQQIRRNLNDREKNKKAISFEIASVINN
jgi:hypothetical protein